MMQKAALAAAAFTFVAAVAPAGWAGPRTPVRAAHLQAESHPLRLGRSVGSPTDGHLVGGSHLDDAPYLRIVPVYAHGDVRWGLGPLVTLVDRSARIVRHQFPDAVMSVGHMSRQGGGDLDRHASHESGRDADIGFYVRSQTGKPLFAEHFVPFKADGTAPSWPGAYFDDAKNWALVASLVTNPPARVTYIFVASPLRARLLAYGERIGAPLAVRNRAAELMVQPRGSLPHDDHFHVRIGCPSGMAGCIEFPTLRTHHLTHLAHERVRHLPEASKPTAHATLPAPAHPAHEARPELHQAEPREAETAPGEASPSHEQEHEEEGDVTPNASIGESFDAVDDVDGPITHGSRTNARPGGDVPR